MVKINRVLIRVLLGSLFLLAGCAEAGDEGETAAQIPLPLPNACSLLDEADIAEAFGTAVLPVGAGEMDEEGGVSSCEWTFPEDVPGTMSLVVWAGDENDAGAQQSIFIRGQAGLTDGKDDRVVPVSGLGDEAYFRFDNLTSFWWRKGSGYAIHLSVSDYPIGWEAFYELARQVDQSDEIS